MRFRFKNIIFDTEIKRDDYAATLKYRYYNVANLRE